MSRSLLFRLRASGMHLLGSALVIGLFLWLIYGFWYVYPYQIVFSTIDVVKILIGVDLVLGPLLTLIVFNIAKPRKELVRDLVVILGVQLSALAWGVHVTYSARPLFVVYSQGEFFVVTRNEIDMNHLPGAVPSRTFFGEPVTVYLRNPETEAEYKEYMEDLSVRKMPIALEQPQRYMPFMEHRSDIALAAQKIDDYADKPEYAGWLAMVRANWEGHLSNTGFYRLTAGDYTFIVLMRLDNGQFLEATLDQSDKK